MVLICKPHAQEVEAGGLLSTKAKQNKKGL
jgi:hypothetical protein